MPREDNPSDLIAAIYDTAIDSSRWDEVVRRIVEATKSISGVVLAHQLDSLTHHVDASRVEASYNVDPFYSDAFEKTYYKASVNPLTPAAVALAPGEVLAASFITQTDRFRATAFYNEFLRPQGCADCVGIGLCHTPAASEMLVLQRSPNATLVEPPEWHLLETIAPHLKRASELHQELARARALTGSLGAAVAAAGFAVFLLSEDSRILFANAKAEDLMRLGALRCEGGRLAGGTPPLTHRLHTLARHAAKGWSGGTLELPRSEDRPLLAHVIPLAPHRALPIFDIDRPAAAVFIADPASNSGAQIRRFAERFGLTPGETRVLTEILAGSGLSAAAMALKITRATVRTHAQHIFEKTGTERQTELIRLFFETAIVPAMWRLSFQG